MREQLIKQTLNFSQDQLLSLANYNASLSTSKEFVRQQTQKLNTVAAPAFKPTQALLLAQKAPIVVTVKDD